MIQDSTEINDIILSPMLHSHADSIIQKQTVWDTLVSPTIAPANFTTTLTHEGMESLWRTSSFFHSDTVIAILLSLLILLSITIAFFRKAKIHYFASIFNNKLESGNTNTTVLEQWKQVTYGFFGLIGFASFALYLVVNKQGLTNSVEIWELFGFMLLSFFCYFFAKYILLRLYVYTFFSSVKSIAIRQYFAILFYTGQIIFLFFLGVLFTESYLHIYWYYLLLGLILLSLFSMLYVIYKTFFNKIDLIFYFILYLCTLEILPLLVLQKLLSGDIYFINH